MGVEHGQNSYRAALRCRFILTGLNTVSKDKTVDTRMVMENATAPQFLHVLPNLIFFSAPQRQARRFQIDDHNVLDAILFKIVII